MKKIAFIGCGNMGEAMLAGVLNQGFAQGQEICVHSKRAERRQTLESRYGVMVADSNAQAVQGAKLVVLAVKPNIYEEVLTECKPFFNDESLILGIAPAYTIGKLKSLVEGSGAKIVRAMPNTPALVGAGMTGVSYDTNLTIEEKAYIQGFLEAFGQVIEVKEDLMPAVGSVSGSSPAFIYMVIEAMAQAAIALGLPAKDAYQFAQASVAGSAKLVGESEKHPGQLRDAVCSAGGTTITGVNCLEKNGFKGNLIEAMEKTAERFRYLEDQASR